MFTDSNTVRTDPISLAVAHSDLRDKRERVLTGLTRKTHPAQAALINEMAEHLIDRDERIAFINGAAGTGKNGVAIALAAVLHAEGYRRTLIISAPHLASPWREEILETVPGAEVFVLNGPEALVRYLQRVEPFDVAQQQQTFLVLGWTQAHTACGLSGFNFIQRHLPEGMFNLVDAAHAHDRKDGRAIEAVIAARARKLILLTDSSDPGAAHHTLSQ